MGEIIWKKSLKNYMKTTHPEKSQKTATMLNARNCSKKYKIIAAELKYRRQFFIIFANENTGRFYSAGKLLFEAFLMPC